MKKAVLAGGSGFLGTHVGRHLKAAGYEVVVLSRSAGGGEFRTVKWDGKSVGDWAGELDGATAVINFSGAPIDKKWTEKYKRVLKSSRVEPATAIGSAIGECMTPPEVWINLSAVGYYGDSGDESMGESHPSGKGFMPELCQAWEDAVWGFDLSKTRRVVTRMGVVLGKDGGAFPILSKLTAGFLGGAVGDGKQYMSWVHVDDVCGIMHWAIETDVSGALNVVAPDPRRNADFMKALREEMGRPFSPPVPGFLLELGTGLVGMEGAVLLQGQRVYPVVAEARGYRHMYPRLEGALEDLVG